MTAIDPWTGFRYIEYVDEWGDPSWCIEARKKFPSGMTGIMQFKSIDWTDNSRTYNVYVDLRRKRKKSSEDRAITGRDGLEPASWVLTTLSGFERLAPYIERGFHSRIEIMAVDDKRWSLYERVLTRRGYSATMVHNNKTLVKRIGAM